MRTTEIFIFVVAKRSQGRCIAPSSHRRGRLSVNGSSELHFRLADIGSLIRFCFRSSCPSSRGSYSWVVKHIRLSNELILARPHDGV
ncbi:hypothetical protein IGI04_004651 [Brassica rapa subsp. trilocularis]|uniref:Uncharacterized protein n=1 Tax=Brassica rapa subsp. trilocularis TaxID=1813537 RepID=A0ABQ7NBR3_BRACM|nr:hypothetical protein IGI04_004651 [Brassica rapa subsp. trilocularis]